MYLVTLILMILAQGLANGTSARQESADLAGIRDALTPLLRQYCGNACQYIDADLAYAESLDQLESVGFDAVDGVDTATELSSINLRIQIADRVSEVNRSRLADILSGRLSSFAPDVTTTWQVVSPPRIGASAGAEKALLSQVESRVRKNVSAVMAKYCPDACILGALEVEGSLVGSDAASRLGRRQVVTGEDSQTFLAVERVVVDLSIDQKLSPEAQQKLTDLFAASLTFVEPVELNVGSLAFPDTYSERQQAAEDPYGLNKLKETLRVFQDLAGTKEIISTSSQDSSRSEMTVGDYWVYGLLALLLVAAGFVYRFNTAKQDAAYLMRQEVMGEPRPDQQPGEKQSQKSDATPAGSPKPILKYKIDALKQELIDIFMGTPKIAQETFGRMLSEDGVEHTAQYVHIFGHLVVFELLQDANLQRSLFDLSEYYHGTEFSFSEKEQLDLLVKLKTRVTASEIKVMARHTLDKFDFLSKLDPVQLYNLIVDEKPTVQSLVLTQVEPSRRRRVFDLFHGDSRVKLLEELCKAESIPREYLLSVATALSKKVATRPEFDAQNLRSTDILIDLLEKSPLADQKKLMTSLQRTKPDAARAIKLKLVTVHLLSFLKDGHLLEMILGMEREDLLIFLAGCDESIRGLLLSKAPEELAESWNEDLESIGGVDDQQYQEVEAAVIRRIRNLASNGSINLLELNDLMFDGRSNQEPTSPPEMPTQRRHLVA